MNKRKSLFVIIAILATIGVAFGAVLMLWTRTPTLFITNVQYQNVKLLAPVYGVGATFDIAKAIAENGANNPEASQWYRNPSNDHEYMLIITIGDISQCNNGVLRVNFTDIATYTSLNISKVDEVTITDLGSGNWQLTNETSIATNQLLDTTIPFAKTDVTYNVDATHKRAIIMYLSEYQIAPTSETSVTLHSVIDLGVDV